MTYSEAELLPTANILVNYILEPIQHQSLYKKYAHKKYLKVRDLLRPFEFCSLTFSVSAVQRVHEAVGIGAMGREYDGGPDGRLVVSERRYSTRAGSETRARSWW